MREMYRTQTALVLKILPLLTRFPHFALKGGTAINYFFRPFPRMSVDIDLTFLPVWDRPQSLETISTALNRLAQEIVRIYPDVVVAPKQIQKQTAALRVYEGTSLIKIEPNLVIRGAVLPPQMKRVAAQVESEFGMSANCLCLSFADLYGGKICAALDRQHPRDLFDIKLLIENEGLADETRRAFIVYLISHPRPMAELLSPNLLDIESTFNNEFIGMTRVTVALDDLLAARQYLLTWIHQTLTHDERRFILSVKNGQPDWSLSPFPDIDKLPAVKWKLLNIMQMNHKKRESAYQKLKSILDL